jgi:hypothetical protein
MRSLRAARAAHSRFGLWDGRAPSRLNILEICRTFARQKYQYEHACWVFRTSGSRFARPGRGSGDRGGRSRPPEQYTLVPAGPGARTRKGRRPLRRHVENRGQRLGGEHRCAPCDPPIVGRCASSGPRSATRRTRRVTIAGATNPDAGDQTTAYTSGSRSKTPPPSGGMAGSNLPFNPAAANLTQARQRGMHAPNNLPPLQRRRQLNDQRNIGLTSPSPAHPAGDHIAGFQKYPHRPGCRSALSD